MTLEEAKQKAGPVRYFGEIQFITGTPEDCELIEHVFGGFDIPGKVNGKPVIAYRTHRGTNYSDTSDGWCMVGGD